MEKSENIINEVYNFLSESNFIPRKLSTNKKESDLLKKLDELHCQNILSDADYNDLFALFCKAISENEISGFVSGIYIAEKIKREFNENYI